MNEIYIWYNLKAPIFLKDILYMLALIGEIRISEGVLT